jgi:murein DD-endopeptidase MepM/ murein hydrolase activator NlpD
MVVLVALASALAMALVVGSPAVPSWAWRAGAPSEGEREQGIAMVRRGLDPLPRGAGSHAVEAARQGQPPEPTGTPTRPAGRITAWDWPVPEPHEVVRGFDPPGAPWGAGHRGVDLRTVVGGPVLSPYDGVVSFAGVIAGREVLVIAHADGLRSTFEPVRSAGPVGTAVPRGHPVGTVTSTRGHCPPGTCLHWGVLRGAVYLDPLAFVRLRVVLLPLRAPP